MSVYIQPLSRRILSRLRTAEAEEPDPWQRDDLQIARLTVLHAARGDAVLCSPHVLASYTVLGLHPEKVWPAIQARRQALLGSAYEDLLTAPPVPKKPAQSIKLWCEEINGARAVNSRAACSKVLRELTNSEPMAAPSIAALYPNPQLPSSAKTRQFTYDEVLAIIEFSGAPHSIRQGTLSALKARGRWPNEDGPVTGVVCVSLIGMMFHGGCCRSTARWRARRACALGFWRQLRPANSWAKCPKCSAERTAGTCGQCGYRGRAKNPDGSANFNEFCRPYMYEIDIQKFRSAQRCKELRHFDARTYAEYKQGEHRNVTEMPRKPAAPAPPLPPAPAAPVPERNRPAAEHRSTERHAEEKAPQPKMTRRECAKFIADMAFCMKGQTEKVGVDHSIIAFAPGDPRYLAPMNWRDAMLAVAKEWKRAPEAVAESLKFWGYQSPKNPADETR